MSSSARPRDASFTAEDIDLDLVADELADGLEPVDAAALRALLSRDPAAQARHDELAAALDGLAGLLAAEPVPPLPDDVLIRVDSAIARESADRATDGARAASRAGAPARTRRRGLGRWAGGLLGTAAVAGGLILAVHSLGGASTTTASSPASSAAAGAAAAGSAVPAGPPVGATRPSAQALTVVTPLTLDSVVRGLVDARTSPRAPAAVAPSQDAGPVAPELDSAPSASVPFAAPATPAAAAASAAAATRCLPGGVPATATIVAEQVVSFRGRPATLVVFRQPGTPDHRVHAEVFGGCGGAALLSRTVSITP